jgi:hypothetical protein
MKCQQQKLSSYHCFYSGIAPVTEFTITSAISRGQNQPFEAEARLNNI